MKRSRAIAVALILSVFVFLTGFETANANNYQDTTFNFKLGGVLCYTPARKKTDTSKLYMKCNYMSVSGESYSASANGTNSKSKNGVDCSNNHSYHFGVGTYHYMYSLVKERGYTYARIQAAPDHANSFVAKGVWSPDNLNKY